MTDTWHGSSLVWWSLQSIQEPVWFYQFITTPKRSCHASRLEFLHDFPQEEREWQCWWRCQKCCLEKGFAEQNLLEIVSLLLLLSKKNFLILPLKSLNWMKYVMQQNNSLNTSRIILSTFTAHKNSIMLPLKTRKLLVTS